MIPNPTLHSPVVDGIFNGVGTLVFLPQILLLFCSSEPEDSGYLACRADRRPHHVTLRPARQELHTAFGVCLRRAAIMATRTIENKRDRIATILIAPFMTCSARLPVYILVVAALYRTGHCWAAFEHATAAYLSLYVLGLLAAVVTARLLKSTVMKSARSSFMLEMPPYRWPTFRGLALRLIDRSKVFLRRAGTVILAVALIIWVLAHLPVHDGQPPEIGQSVVGMIGHAVEPAIKPLGFNWKIGIGLITSLAAREVIVGTLGLIYGIEDPSAKSEGLQHALQQDRLWRRARSALVFFAFAMQCSRPRWLS
jgi:ferrous iron transport protein B